MKKTMVMLLALFLAFPVLAAYAYADDGAALAGKYNVQAMLDDKGAETMNFQEMFKEAGLSADSMYLEFLSDGKCKMVTPEETMEGTFKLDGKSLKLTFDSEVIDGSVDGNKIIISDKDASMGLLYEKQ